MTTTRYFEVKVTGCKDCPWKTNSCGHGKFWCRIGAGVVSQCIKLYDENKDQLTPSCPMWNETKKSETK